MGALMLSVALGTRWLPIGPDAPSLCDAETHVAGPNGLSLTLHSIQTMVASNATAVLPGQYAFAKASVTNVGVEALDLASLTLQPYSFWRPLPIGATVDVCEQIECPLLPNRTAEVGAPITLFF